MTWNSFFLNLIPLLLASFTGACFSAFFVNRAWTKAIERGNKKGVEAGIRKAYEDYWKKYHITQEWRKK